MQKWCLHYIGSNNYSEMSLITMLLTVFIKKIFNSLAMELVFNGCYNLYFSIVNIYYGVMTHGC